MNAKANGRVTESERVSCSQRTYDFLLDELLAKRLQPGDEINRRQIAESLNISVAPVNEAVAQLAVEGFLEISPRKQTRVKNLRIEETRGLLILREAMECQAARIYCGERVTASRAMLLKLAEDVDNSLAGTRHNELAEIAFHMALVDLVDSPIISAEFTRIMRRKLFHRINLVLPAHQKMPVDSHQRLVKKLQSQDPDEAEKAMRNHLERGRERLLEVGE